MEYICHFCTNHICKPTGWAGAIEYCWECELCNTEYCRSNPHSLPHFPATHWAAFRCTSHVIFIDFVEKETTITPFKKGSKSLDSEKAVILSYIIDVNPSNKNQWIQRVLKLKAFL